VVEAKPVNDSIAKCWCILALLCYDRRSANEREGGQSCGIPVCRVLMSFHPRCFVWLL
jgi:hypothetical protein